MSACLNHDNTITKNAYEFTVKHFVGSVHIGKRLRAKRGRWLKQKKQHLFGQIFRLI